MSTTARELIKGLAGATGFLLCAFPFGLPLVVAIGIAFGVYVGLGLLLPKAVAADSSAVTLGLNTQERDFFLATCRKANAELARLAGQIPKREFADRVRELAKTSGNLVGYLEKNPDAILMSSSVPRNLEYLVAMLRQYAAISSFQQAGETTEEALRRVEDLIDTAGQAFHGMYQQLLNNDAAALDASAHTLAILMGLDDETGQPRAPQHTAPLPPRSTSPVPPRLPEKNKTS